MYKSKKFYEAQHNYNSDDNPKVNVFFKNDLIEKEKSEINVVVIEADKTLKDLIENYLAKIGK